MVLIWGIYHYNRYASVTRQKLIDMVETADGQESLSQKTVTFGISGLGQKTYNNQSFPLHNEKKTLFIVFDGYITNRDELANQLCKRNYRFDSLSSSAEIVLHLFEEQREEAFKKLNGMFAFAIWDNREKKLLLVRDRFGIRPLYYFDDGKSLIFASQIKNILESKDVKKELNFQALYDYFSFNYVPFSQTAFRGIEKVPPKSYMKYVLKGKSKELYWDFTLEPELKLSQKEIEEELGQRLKAAVKRLLPLYKSPGVFLSGGLDSAAITYCLRELKQEPIETYAISFKQKEYDESRYGQIVSEHLGTKHHVIPLNEEIVKEYERIIISYENLHAETSMIPFYYLARAAGKDKKCMLSGESGDEFLGGYAELLADKLLTYYKKIPFFIRKFLIVPLIETLPVSDAPVSFDYKAKHFLTGAEKEPLEAHYYWREVFTKEEKQKLLNKDLLNLKINSETFEVYSQRIRHYTFKDTLRSFQCAYWNILIPDNNIPYYNVLCAAHSIDVRYPFLDYELIDFMSRIPMAMKLKGLATKNILRHFLKDKFPRTIVARKKHGLSCPIKIWIREEMKDIFLDRLSKTNLKQHGYLNTDYVQQLLKEHLERKVDNSRKIWGLFCFVVWCDGYLAS